MIGNKSVYKKAWSQAGIQTIQDLCEGNSLLSKEGLEQRFKISCEYMFYNGLRAAIPRSWLDKIQAAKNEEITCIVLDKNQPLSVMLKNRLIDIRKATCSQLFCVEIDKIVERPTCYFKWNQNTTLQILSGI